MELAGNAFSGGVVAACFTSIMAVVPWAEVFNAARESSEDDGEDEEEESEDVVTSAVSTPAPSDIE